MIPVNDREGKSMRFDRPIELLYLPCRRHIFKTRDLSPASLMDKTRLS
jgi:hypothetical protein